MKYEHAISTRWFNKTFDYSRERKCGLYKTHRFPGMQKEEMIRERYTNFYLAL